MVRESQGGGGGQGEAGDQDRTARERVSDGFNRGLGVLSAFKEALEQTISEARERGDFSVDRARDAMKSAVDRAREATTEARDRFDFVSAAEFEELEARVRALEERFGGNGPKGGSGGG
jgi:polyhydroxyalkanoate synthesis regulator phasin